VQNAEQGASTLWARINQATNFKPRDQLYSAYGSDQFRTLNIDEATDPELYKFVEHIKNVGPKFYGYPIEQLEYFARRIYELRKD